MTRKKNNKQLASGNINQVRRNIRYFTHFKRMVAAVVGISLGVLGVGLLWPSEPGGFDRLIAGTKWQIIGTTARLGFRVEDILAVGRGQTGREELLKAVRVSKGAPILAFDIEAARRRVEDLPWIKSAQIERILPQTIFMKVEEREPLAIWQHQGQFSLIDHEGAVILRDKLDRFANLIVVVGEGAPKHAAELLKILANEPQLHELVEAAVWVGGRRWNIRLTGNIDVRLPEINAKNAWKRLGEYERTHSVLDRDVKILDLRMPDRLIVRKTPRATPQINAKGQKT